MTDSRLLRSQPSPRSSTGSPPRLSSALRPRFGGRDDPWYVRRLSTGGEIPRRFELDVSDPLLPNHQLLRFALGEVADLDEERFAPESARSGLWEPLTALRSEATGLFFAEPYDPDKIPILFVHGIGGTPRDLRTLIESLDRDRPPREPPRHPAGRQGP